MILSFKGIKNLVKHPECWIFKNTFTREVLIFSAAFYTVKVADLLIILESTDDFVMPCTGEGIYVDI